VAAPARRPRAGARRDGRAADGQSVAARPTDFVVEAAGRSWFANCGWDAFGIGAALQADSEFDTHCPDCGEALHIRVRDGKPHDISPVFRVPVPASEWWNDIGFT
jgi:hypothetical protein